MPGTPAPDAPASGPRSVGRSLLLTLPMALWGLLMFSQTLQVPGTAPKVAGLAVFLFMTTLFFLMMRTRVPTAGAASSSSRSASSSRWASYGT
jgi:hypothetical protein